jgi:hypothetical protein
MVIGKCWDVLSLTLGRVAYNRLPGIYRFLFDKVTFVCFLVLNVAVHFKYQKYTHFLNGRIVIDEVLNFL